MTTVADCVRALRKAAALLDESPFKADYEALGERPASATVIRVMGGWNEAKAAAGLPTNTSTGSRVNPKPSDVSLPEGMDWEELSVDQRWHHRNVEWNTQRTLDKRAKLRAWVFEYKRNKGGCTRCGESDPTCLDFHRLDTEEKTMSISALINYEPSLDRLRGEIEKCEIVCANGFR